MPAAIATDLATDVDPVRPAAPAAPGTRPILGTGPRSPLGRFFGVVTRPDSYRSIAYLLLGLPLGTIWFTAIVTGVSVAAGLVVVALVGIPLLLGLWYVTRAFGNVERAVANALLGQDLPFAPLAATGPSARGNPWARLRAMSAERDRRREAAYLLLRFPAGVASFTVATTALFAPLALAWAPVNARISDHPFGDWALSARMEDAATSSWSWLLIPAGALLFIGAFHLLHALARASARWNDAWLR